MKYYKQLLLDKLVEDGWELVSQDSDTDWWLEEVWCIKSVKQNWGYELKILFLVDPQYDGNRKDQAVWAISAVIDVPQDRPLQNECVIEMDLQKGKFDSKLTEFVAGIKQHRNSSQL